ncbi:ankyrin repeat-containing domain protein [Aspergillus floccosus]
MRDRVTDVNERSGWQDPTALARAVSRQNLSMVNLLLARGADINALLDIGFDQDFGVTTVLGLAVQKKNLQIIQTMLQSCVNVDPRLEGLPYVSPLALAVEAGDTTITRLLLRAGELSLLERALKQKNVEMSRLLIEYGARIHMSHSVKQQNSSALLLAVQNGDYEIIGILLQAGAPLDEVYGDAPGTVLAGLLQDTLEACGGTILARAIFDRKPDLAQWLLGHNIDVDGHSTELDTRNSPCLPGTPLQAAIQTKNLSFVEIIMARGAKAVDCDLAAAVDRGEIGLLRRLLTGFLGCAPTAIGCAIVTEQQEAIRLIIEAGADPTGTPQLFKEGWYQDDGLDFEPEDPQSVLEIAAQTDDRSILQVLLQTCIWDKRLTGRALTIAIIFHCTELIDDILELVVDMNQEIMLHYPDWVNEYDEDIVGWDEVLTPLQAAVKNQLVSIVQLLVKSPHTKIDYLGADVNAAPARRNGRTALEGAAEHGRIDMIRLFLDEGASLVGDDGGRQYRRAVELAGKNGHVAAAKLLKSFKDRVEECGN